jgi:hypothetical protein
LLRSAICHPKSPFTGLSADELERYQRSCDASSRIERALKGFRDLISIVEAAEQFSLDGGPPDHIDLEHVVASIAKLWVDDLERRPTISGHKNDPRGTKDSRFLSYILRCTVLLGLDIDQQLCRTLLQNLSNKATGLRAAWFHVDDER